MHWAEDIRLVGLGAMMALLSGPKWARRLLLALGGLMLALSTWQAVVCLQRSGFGTVALVAALRTILIFLPFAMFNGTGIALGWLAMKLMKVPTDRGVWEWYRQSRWPNRRF